MRYQTTLYSLMLLIAAGCTGNTSDFNSELEPANGKVMINGEAAANVLVTFVPTGETKGTGAVATTDEQGKFKLMHRTGQEGVEVGKYKVTFSKFALRDGSPIPPGEDGAISGMEHIPPKYSNLDQSREVAEVRDGGDEFLFELQYKTDK